MTQPIVSDPLLLKLLCERCSFVSRALRDSQTCPANAGELNLDCPQMSRLLRRHGPTTGMLPGGVRSLQTSLQGLAAAGRRAIVSGEIASR